MELVYFLQIILLVLEFYYFLLSIFILSYYRNTLLGLFHAVYPLCVCTDRSKIFIVLFYIFWVGNPNTFVVFASHYANTLLLTI